MIIQSNIHFKMNIKHRAKYFMKSHNRLIKQLFFVLIIAVICTWIVYQIDRYRNTAISRKNLTLDTKQEPSTSGFFVNTKGCRIHYLDPFDPSIKSYFYNENLNCDKNNLKPLVKFTTKELYVDKDNIVLYLNISLDLRCCYTPFWRVEVKPGVDPYRYDNTFEFSEDCFSFIEKTEISYDFVKVTCTSGNRTIYKDYFSFVQKKKNKKINPNDRSKVSVLTLGLDAVSRNNLYRQLPKTVNLLHDLGAVEMLGYNKVGDNTFPNLIPALTGLEVSELRKKCWFNDSTEFDKCNFIWDYFYENGYQTSYSEDSAKISTFNYNIIGFRRQPTDFYYRVFSRVSEKDMGNEYWLNTYNCLGNRLTIQYLLDSAKSFVINLKDILSFGFFWSNSISHDYLNLPKYSDQIYYDFLKDIKNNGILDRTVVFFMSDHGIRWGGFRTTYHGYVEERLPFLFILYPKWFNEKYPNAVSNIKRNKRRLTTPFDLHETYKHLLNISTLSKHHLKIISKQKGTKERGTSLFLPISEERTCKDAGIPYNWCTCHQSTPEKVNNTLVIEATKNLIIYLNNLLSGYRQCSKLTLETIIKARSEKILNSDNGTYHIVKDYTVTIKTNPGSALFQATVRYFKLTQEFNVLEPVSRINTYGNQSNCVTNYKLKLYCYCLDLWQRTKTIINQNL